MGNSQSKARPSAPLAPVDAPRRPQNKLSKPRTNSNKITPSNIILLDPSSASAVPSRRTSSSIAPSAESDRRQSSLNAPSTDADAFGTRSRSGNTRQRLRDSLFRSKSYGSRSRTSSLVPPDEAARDAAVDGWPALPGQGDGQLNITFDFENKQPQISSTPTSRRGSSAFAGYSHTTSRLSRAAEALTTNFEEASRRLEDVLERPFQGRTQSEVDIIPMRRRSMLMTPGVATRRDSNGELLYEPFPASRRVSAAATVGSKRNNYFGTFTTDLSVYSELPAFSPLHTVPSPDTPRMVTPCEQEFTHLGAYKIGTLRITNADNCELEADGPVNLSIEIPPPVKVHSDAANGDPVSQCGEVRHSLSPFSFEHSRSPSLRLEATSKNSAVEDELFEDDLDPHVEAGSPSDALRILDSTAGTDSSNTATERGPKSPVVVTNLHASSNTTIAVSKPDKPLTKNDSGYSSIRSFKLRAEARATGSQADSTGLYDKETQPSQSESTLKTQSVSLPTSPLHEQLGEQTKAATSSSSRPVESSKPWSLRSDRPNLTIGRKFSSGKSLKASPGEAEGCRNSSASPTALMRKLTQKRQASQPIVTVTSDRDVDAELIPAVSVTASASLGERDRECPTLFHTYQNPWKTNSSETLTTILSMNEMGDAAAEHISPLCRGTPVPTVKEEDLLSRHTSTKSESGSTAKTLWRNTSQAEFETHITSFGTVSESLGASPYDLAVSAMVSRKRSRSCHSISNDWLTSSDRSHSWSDLAPHNIRKPTFSARTCMDAETASKVAREKSRDRAISRQMGLQEKMPDDRSSLPSNEITRADLAAASAPSRSPRARRRNSCVHAPRSNDLPPVTMSAYRKYLPSANLVSTQVQQQAPAATTVGSPNYPRSGSWVPRPPRGVHSQSINNISYPDGIERQSQSVRSASTKPPMERMRATQPSKDPYHYGYEAGCELAGSNSASMRGAWAKGGGASIVHVHSLSLGDAPALGVQRVRQQA